MVRGNNFVVVASNNSNRTVVFFELNNGTLAVEVLKRSYLWRNIQIEKTVNGGWNNFAGKTGHCGFCKGKDMVKRGVQNNSTDIRVVGCGPAKIVFTFGFSKLLSTKFNTSNTTVYEDNPVVIKTVLFLYKNILLAYLAGNPPIDHPKRIILSSVKPRLNANCITASIAFRIFPGKKYFQKLTLPESLTQTLLCCNCFFGTIC